MSDLTDVPTHELIAELDRRETALTAELTTLLDWRAPTTCSASCSADGNRIVAAIAAEHNISKSDIMGRVRVPYIARARQLAMVELHQAGHSLSEVGRFFERDHGTIIHALKAIKQNPPQQTAP